MAYKRCKRGPAVHAMGIDAEGNVEYSRNYNTTECTNEVGNCGCVHAEMGLLKKMPNPVHVVCSLSPCLMCAIALVGAGVSSVHYLKEYRITSGIDYLIKNGVQVTTVPKEEQNEHI